MPSGSVPSYPFANPTLVELHTVHTDDPDNECIRLSFGLSTICPYSCTSAHTPPPPLAPLPRHLMLFPQFKYLSACAFPWCKLCTWIPVQHAPPALSSLLPLPWYDVLTLLSSICDMVKYGCVSHHCPDHVLVMCWSCAGHPDFRCYIYISIHYRCGVHGHPTMHHNILCCSQSSGPAYSLPFIILPPFSCGTDAPSQGRPLLRSCTHDPHVQRHPVSEERDFPIKSPNKMQTLRPHTTHTGRSSICRYRCAT